MKIQTAPPLTIWSTICNNNARCFSTLLNIKEHFEVPLKINSSLLAVFVENVKHFILGTVFRFHAFTRFHTELWNCIRLLCFFDQFDCYKI